MRQQRAHLFFTENGATCDLLLGALDPSLSLRICQELEGRLERLQILSGDKNHTITSIFRDLYSLVSGGNIFGDLRKPSFDLRQRQCRHRPES